VRMAILPIIFVAFLLGLCAFFYAKWVEQPGIKAGSLLVKRLLDEDVNPRYADSPAALRWTIRVSVAKTSTLHMGQTFLECPVISIYALCSENAEGQLVRWPLPEAFNHGLLFERAKKVIVDDGTDAGW
jgi:hypothetical protein